jgi:hypothetical protein
VGRKRKPQVEKRQPGAPGMGGRVEGKSQNPHTQTPRMGHPAGSAMLMQRMSDGEKTKVPGRKAQPGAPGPALTGWAKVWRASGARVDEGREIHGSEDPPLQQGIYVTVELETFACGVNAAA